MNDSIENQSTEAPEIEGDSGAYTVSLPAFEGPLDLLWHLIRQHKINIYDIPIVMITEQYNVYLEAMEELNLEVAADYIYMAALLIHVKSKMLLPREDSGDEESDPRRELIDRLLEHQKFKSVAESFAELDAVRIGVWSRPPTKLPEGESVAVDMGDVSLFHLVDAFRNALKRYERAHPRAMELSRLVYKVSDKMAELVALLQERSPIRLSWYLEGRDRAELVTIFLAVLELVRLGGVSLQQQGCFSEVLLGATGREILPSDMALFDN